MEKDLYVFVGHSAVIGAESFDRFGQLAEFTAEQFTEVSKRTAFIPFDDFESLQIPVDDCVKYGSVHYNGRVPAEFAAKVEAAREMYRSMRSAA